MADATTELSLLLTAKDQASKELDGLKKNVGGLGETLGKVGTIASGFLAANVVSAGVEKLTSFVGDSIAAAKESKAVNAQLDAVLKSTGGAAGLAADEIRDMASALEKKSLFEDEAILNGQNLLLTFTNIGRDVFPQATQTILDMSQALGQDMKSSAVQLGKALNDPINGITALSRVGVSFTEEQKEQIRTMQEAGDVAGAQALILAELNKEFGGSAKAASDAAGASELYKDRMNDLREQIGEKMLPIQLKWQEAQAAVVTVISTQVIPAIDNFIKYIRTVLEDGDTLNDYLANLPEPIQGVAKAMGETALFIQQHWDTIMAVFNFAVDYVKTRIDGYIMIIESIVEITTSMVNLVSDIFHGRWSEAWGEMKDIASAAVDLLIGYIKATFGNLPEIMYNAGRDAGNALVRGLKDAAGSVLDSVSIQGVSPKDLVNAIPKFDTGGVVPGKIGSPQLVMAHAGETILPTHKAGYTGSGGTVIINQTVNGSILAERDVKRILRDALAAGDFPELRAGFVGA